MHKPEEACSVEMTLLTDTFCWHPFVPLLHQHLAVAIVMDPDSWRLGDGVQRLCPREKVYEKLNEIPILIQITTNAHPKVSLESSSSCVEWHNNSNVEATSLNALKP